jgi:hypothetical protein
MAKIGRPGFSVGILSIRNGNLIPVRCSAQYYKNKRGKIYLSESLRERLKE